jgi:C-terminal processing protease CtpA/Prc
MNIVYNLKAILVLVALSYAGFASAGEKGYLGIALAVDGEGFFLNPTLKTVTIVKVIAKSPAAAAGIAVGDQIIEIEGQKVQGAKANDLKPYFEREIGQTVKLIIKKVSGEIQSISIVAGPKLE